MQSMLYNPPNPSNFDSVVFLKMNGMSFKIFDKL